MINEFYAALINADGNNPLPGPGSDFVPQSWRRRALGSHAKAIQRALLIRPESKLTANWRAIEIRKLVAGSDLLSYRRQLDPRTGYLLNELLFDMTQYLSARVAGGDSAANVKVYGNFEADGYELGNWTVAVTGTNYSITGMGLSESGSVTTGSRGVATLPGTNATINFPVGINDTYAVTWATKPSITILDTAEQLSSSLQGEINKLVTDPSALPQETVLTIRNIILGKSEAPAKVAAAAILFAGAVIAAPAVSN